MFLFIYFCILNKPVTVIGSLVKQGKYVGVELLHNLIHCSKNKVNTNFSASHWQLQVTAQTGPLADLQWTAAGSLCSVQGLEQYRYREESSPYSAPVINTPHELSCLLSAMSYLLVRLQTFLLSFNKFGGHNSRMSGYQRTKTSFMNECHGYW